MRNLFLITVVIALFSGSLNAQYTINDTFADIDETEFMTRDVFVVWWDKDFDYTTTVDALLDRIIAHRMECLNDLNMEDPPSVQDGFYQNIYMHGDGGYFDDNGWGNGVGTDSNGYPFYTMPYWLADNIVTIAHEIFHIFQYNANSPGFEYANDSQWFVEASANWFGARQDFTADGAFIEAESLVRMPHVPLWLSYGNYPADYPNNWQRYVHQYAMALYLFYLTEIVDISPNIISEGFYMNLTETPQEYLFFEVGPSAYRNHFIDWCARMTNDFDFLTEGQRMANEQEYLNYADLSDENEYTEIFDTSGSDGWYFPSNDDVTNAWSFNTYKLENTATTSYTFELSGDTNGIFGTEAYFQAKVLVKDTAGNADFYDVSMVNDTEGALTLDVEESDTEVYFIIASMPSYFEEINDEFQQFPYRMRISNNALGILDNELTSVEAYPNPSQNAVVIKAQETIKDITLYSMLGQPLFSIAENANEVVVNLENQSSGTYFAKVITATGTQVIKLIKE